MSNSTPNFLLCSRLWSSQVGRKFLVAITGAILVLFVIGHLVGNLTYFGGDDMFNSYAYFLHHLLHGAGLWIARIGLLAAILIHIAAAVSLTRENRIANIKNTYPGTIQATRSSLSMIWTGLMILLFVIFHLLHFTVRVSFPAEQYTETVNGITRHNAHLMVTNGFSNLLVVLVYAAAMFLLAMHIRHGLQSLVQTFGWRSKKTAWMLDKLSIATALFVLVGFLSIPVSVYLKSLGN